MAGGGGNKKIFQYCIDSSGQEILNLRALQGHSGRNPIDLVNITPHTSHFLVDSQHFFVTLTLAQEQGVSPTSFHPIHALLLCVAWFSPTFYSLLSIFSHLPFHSPDHLHLPCGGQEPCAPLIMRSQALWPRTILSQVMSPTTSTSQRRLMYSSRSPPATAIL